MQMLSRKGQLFTGGPPQGALQKVSPPLRLLLLAIITGITAFSAHPILLAGIMSAAIILAVISWLDLISILRAMLYPLALLAAPVWIISVIFFDQPWTLAALGILRVASTLAVAMVTIHSLGLINIAPALRRLGLPAELCITWRMMISQAIIFSDTSADMQLARSARTFNQPSSTRHWQTTGRQAAILFARMFQRSRELVMAIDAREIISGAAIGETSHVESSPNPPVDTSPISSLTPKPSFPVFQLQGITHKFTPDTTALDNISAQIHSGTATAIVGANGAGKSTLLHLLAGLITPTSGDLLWCGQPISAALLHQNQALRKDFRRKVSIVFQDSDTQWLCETVRDEIEFGPRQIWSANESRDRAEHCMVTMGITHLAARAPFTLSSGEKRRVALASSMVMSPDILLLDEPTASLDPATTDFLIDWLLDFITQPGKTLIFTTHDLSAVKELAENILVITPCHRLAREGKTADILPDTNFLRQMNLTGRPRNVGLS